MRTEKKTCFVFRLPKKNAKKKRKEYKQTRGTMRKFTTTVIATFALASRVSAFSPNVLKTTATRLEQTSVFKRENDGLLAQESSRCAEVYKGTRLQASADDESFFDGLQINVPYALAYVSFLGFGFFMATTEASGASQVVLDKFLADPINPGVNELFATVFNLLGLVAFPLACLSMPGAKGQKINPLPFLLGGMFAGYTSVVSFVDSVQPLIAGRSSSEAS